MKGMDIKHASTFLYGGLDSWLPAFYAPALNGSFVIDLLAFPSDSLRQNLSCVSWPLKCLSSNSYFDRLATSTSWMQPLQAVTFKKSCQFSSTHFDCNAVIVVVSLEVRPKPLCAQTKDCPLKGCVRLPSIFASRKFQKIRKTWLIWSIPRKMKPQTCF